MKGDNGQSASPWNAGAFVTMASLLFVLLAFIKMKLELKEITRVATEITRESQQSSDHASKVKLLSANRGRSVSPNPQSLSRPDRPLKSITDYQVLER